MRWERLFDDLDAQLTAAQAAELAGEVSDRTRREVGRLHLDDRAAAATGAVLTAGLGAAGTVTGRLARSGPGWWLLAGTTAELVVCTQALTWVSGLPVLAVDPQAQSAVRARLGLPYALRGIARDRSAVTVVLQDGSNCAGTIDRVGADFLDLAEHAPGEPRREAGVLGTRTVVLSSLAVVRAA